MAKTPAGCIPCIDALKRTVRLSAMCALNAGDVRAIVALGYSPRFIHGAASGKCVYRVGHGSNFFRNVVWWPLKRALAAIPSPFE